MEEIAASIPEDLAALRPEDIRVEAEFADLVIATSPEPAAPTPAISPLGEPAAPAAPREAGGPSPSFQELVKAPSPPDDPGLGGVLPPIEIEPATIRPPDRQPHTVREVVLQPAIVLAWSLLVLVSVPMAFVAGLLLGHFVWK
jgi:hypothetical protein